MTLDGRSASRATRSRKRALERNLAAHRALGYGGDMGADAGRRGEFVDAFLADQRRIHVGDQQPLGARRRRLDDDVAARFRGHRRQQRPAGPSPSK